MNKPFLAIVIIMAAGVCLLAVYKSQQKPVVDNPDVIPTKNEVVPLGISTFDIIKTSDEAAVPRLIQPTAMIHLVTQKLLDISCSHGSDYCKLEAIYYFVQKNYEYQAATPEHNYIQSPGETLLQGSGDGLELALLIGSMQRAAGFDNEILQGPYQTFVKVKSGNQSITLDPACQTCLFTDVKLQLSGNEDVLG